jgi:hypothetical protein
MGLEQASSAASWHRSRCLLSDTWRRENERLEEEEKEEEEEEEEERMGKHAAACTI